MIGMLLSVAALMQGPAQPLHYRVDAQTVSKIDLTAQGQGVVTQSAATMALLTVTLRDSAAGRLADISVDSATFDAPGAAAGGVPAEALANPKGTRFHVYVVDGKLSTPAVPTSQTMGAAQIAAAIGIMFPGAHDHLKPGDSWTDSVTADSTALKPTRGKSQVHWTVSAAGEGEFTLTGNSTGTATIGSGPTPMELQATGTEEITTRPGGPARNGTTTTNGQGTVNAAGQSIPLNVMTTTKLAVLP